MAYKSFLILILLLVFGCASSSSTTSNRTANNSPNVRGVESILLNPAMSFYPIHPDYVRIIISPEELTGVEYVNIARLQMKSSSHLFTGALSESAMVERMRNKAGALGANVMIYPKFKVSGIRASWTRSAEAIAIRIRPVLK